MFRNKIIRKVAERRAGAFDRMRRQATALQYAVLRRLLAAGERTAFGREHGVTAAMSAARFAAAVPVRTYDQMKPYIARMLGGETNVAWPGVTRCFARSSGTTSDRSKYIPVTWTSIRRNHARGMADVASMYALAHPHTRLFEGKTLTLGGSCSRSAGAMVGDLSALLIERLSLFGGWFRLPRTATAVIENFDDKTAAICRECTRQRVTSFAGVPSWNLVLMRRVLEYTGKSNLLEVWPDLELFAHGGVGFAPYRRAFEELLPRDDFSYMETYNASEGFFAMADDPHRDDMMLMTDYGIYYEFRSRDGRVCPLEGVRTGGRYAMIITSCNGLWRYEIGDVVEFTSTDPYRIRLVGRTRQFINAFGEELMADTAERALVAACSATHAVVDEYTAAPLYMSLDRRGAHEWAVEFRRRPDDMGRFAKVLDAELRRMNSDYDAKRATTLDEPVVHELAAGTFVGWMRRNGKNKVPHLRNDRGVIDQLTIEN